MMDDGVIKVVVHATQSLVIKLKGIEKQSLVRHRNEVHKTMDGKGSDSEDDFFGNQSEEDSNCEYGSVPLAYGSLTKHESHAQEETHRKIGYHEAYDENKDVKVQEGFENGYRETIDDASKLGALLGKLVMRQNAKGGASDAVSVVKDYLESAQSVEKKDKTATEHHKDGILEITECLERMLENS
jgi:hypothetical protein